MSSEEQNEKKKWLIERIQTLVESYVEKIELERARNKAHTDIVENGLSAWRTALLSGVTVAATIILALSARPVLIAFHDELIVLLIADLLIGLAVFLVFTYLMNKAHNLILNLNGYYFIASDKLADLNSLIIKKTHRIHEIDEEKIYFYWAYLAFASLAVRVYLIDIFNDISKSKIFRKEKSRWRIYWNRQKLTVKQAKDAYDEDPNSFLNRNRSKYISDVVKLNKYIEEFFKYNPNHDRALVVESIPLDGMEQKVDDIYQSIMNEREGKKS
jgi:hypothetical protein